MKQMLLTFLLALPLALSAATAATPQTIPADDISPYGPRSAYRAIQDAFRLRSANISLLEEKFYTTYEPVFYHEPVRLSTFHAHIKELEQLRIDTPELKEKHHDGFYAFNQYWLTHKPPVVKSEPWSWKKRAMIPVGMLASMIATFYLLRWAMVHGKLPEDFHKTIYPTMQKLDGWRVRLSNPIHWHQVKKNSPTITIVNNPPRSATTQPPLPRRTQGGRGLNPQQLEDLQVATALARSYEDQ